MSKKQHNKGAASGDRNHPLFELGAYHRRAIELRYEGHTFKEISGMLAVELRKGVHPDTVRKWFARGGFLNEDYLEYARQENDHRRQLMREELKKLVVKIPTKLGSIMDRMDETGKPDMVALMAIKTIVEILGITANDERQAQDVLGEYFKRLEKAPSPVEHATTGSVQ